MKGWVYVITNKAIPDLVKVGYSRKDPELRAAELNNTGAPHPYMVEYEALVDDPYQVEQKTHRLLFSKREAKEWFRCTSEDAAAAIKQIAGNGVIIETYKRAERAKAEALYQKNLSERDDRIKQQRIKEETESRLTQEETSIRLKYKKETESRFPRLSFSIFWICSAAFALIIIQTMFPNVTGSGALVLASISGAIIGAFLRNYFEKLQKNSKPYILLEQQGQREFEAVRRISKNDQEIEDTTSSQYPSDTLIKLREFVGIQASEEKIRECTMIVERVVEGSLTAAESKKVAIAVKVKIIVNAPKQNIIDMIIKSHPGRISEITAADIVNELAKPEITLDSLPYSTFVGQAVNKKCMSPARGRAFYESKDLDRSPHNCSLSRGANLPMPSRLKMTKGRTSSQ